MEDLFKKLLYAGAGLAVTAKENLEKSIDELVEKGKISDNEGKKIVDDFFEKTQNRKNEFEEKLTKISEEIANKMNYVKKTDVDALVKRVEELEAKVAKSKKADTTA
jgi:polyhydroxyalkanoate synthesis regulator phasin